jgi:predicted alpha/beta hydrolase family esterase
MKTVLLCPGFTEDIKTRDYSKLVRAIKDSGYEVKFIPIEWKRTTITDWVVQLEEEYKKYDPKNTVLAGFSYGSMTAFVAAAHRPPAELWLFSLSPYFAEDLPNLNPAWVKNIGKKRRETFSALIFADLVKKIPGKTLIFAGQIELDKYSQLAYRFHEAHQFMKGSKFIVAQDVGHDVTNPNYIKAIIGNI